MEIYHYHPTSGVLLCRGTADQSPLEDGVFLIPANATEAAPPEVSGEQQAVYRGGGWTVETIAPPDVAPLPTLDQLKMKKNLQINAARALANSSTFLHDTIAFSCDALSRSDIDGINGYVALNDALPPSFIGAWKAADNRLYPIADVAGWKALYGSMVAAGAANFAHSQALKQALEAAMTAEDVAAIVW